MKSSCEGWREQNFWSACRNPGERKKQRMLKSRVENLRERKGVLWDKNYEVQLSSKSHPFGCDLRWHGKHENNTHNPQSIGLQLFSCHSFTIPSTYREANFI